MARETGFDGRADVGVEFEVCGFGVGGAGAGFVNLLFLLLRFKANLFFSLFGS